MSMDDLAQTYQKKTDKEHILDNPDTYIGSIEEDDTVDWLLTDENKMKITKFRWIPGLYKCFDEAAVNARDHWIRLSEKKDIKYLENSAAGCLTFMEITKKNRGTYFGFIDDETAVFINQDNYKEKFD